MARLPERWDMEVDLVAVGSGMAGCAAAITARDLGQEVIVLEKSDKAGGGTTYSLGIVWIGNNHLEQALGLPDSREETLAYMKFLGGGYELEELLRTFVDMAPLALRYFVEQGGIPFEVARKFPDHYYTRAPGNKPEGRNLLTRPFPAKSLGEWRDRLRASPYAVARVTFEEMLRWGGRANYRQWDHALVAERVQEDIRTFGAGLAGHFVKAALDRSVPLLLETSARELITAHGAVVGVWARKNGRDLAIRARRGVVLATGGYEANKELIRRFEEFPQSESKFPPSIAGDGLILATEIGAALTSIPFFQVMLAFSIPGESHDGVPFYREAGISELGFPHAILVNDEGKRFADESFYASVMIALRQFDLWKHRHPNLRCFLIFDQNYLDKYPFADIRPGSPAPEWLPRARTLPELARKLEISPTGLAATVRRFNRVARKGEDPDFGRGALPWVQAMTGDFTHQPNPNLGPVEKPPFYGVRLTPNVSSSTGLLINAHAQVLNVRGHPISGLYACGAAGPHFYGLGYQAGYQLAGGMVFGYLAARHAVGQAPL
jgi:3-oxosteroid 1-dehydrogenase